MENRVQGARRAIMLLLLWCYVNIGVCFFVCIYLSRICIVVGIFTYAHNNCFYYKIGLLDREGKNMDETFFWVYTKKTVHTYILGI